MTEKASTFKIADIPAVQDLLKGHEAAQSARFPSNNQRRLVAAGEMQREEYELMIKMFEHDIRAYEQWVLRCEDRESARYHADLQFKNDRQNAAKTEAKNLFLQNSRDWKMTLCVMKDPAEGMKNITDLLKKISQTFDLTYLICWFVTHGVSVMTAWLH